MVARLLPIIRLQVQLLSLLGELKCPSALHSTTSSLERETAAAVEPMNRQSITNYTLPEFPIVLRQPLQSASSTNFKIGSKNRMMLVDAIHDDLIKRGVLYPSRMEYDRVMSGLMLHYPFLVDFDGSSSSWRAALRRKFKRCRQPLIQEGVVADFRAKYGRPGVSGRKRTRVDNDTDGEILTKAKRFQKQALDETLLGEDSKSIAKHVALMKSEIKKKERNRFVLRDAMTRTAAYRQKYCHEHTTTEVLDEFPVLKIAAFLIADVKLLYNVDIKLISTGLLALKDKIVNESVRRNKKNGDLVQSYKMRMEESLSQEIQDDLNVELCVRLLTSLFAEDDSLIHEPTGEVKVLTPCITGVGEFNLSIDQVPQLMLTPMKSFRRALEAWLASYWIFSIEFPIKLKNTCCFLEKVVLKNGGKVTAAVRKWTNRLMLQSQ